AAWDLVCQTESFPTQTQAASAGGPGTPWGADFESVELRLPVLTSFTARALQEAQASDGCRQAEDDAKVKTLAAELAAAEA
ncbi:unnamed protein product, partial [Symbiodinium pilosum]